MGDESNDSIGGSVTIQLERWTCISPQSHTDRLLDLFSVVPSLNPQLCL